GACHLRRPTGPCAPCRPHVIGALVLPGGRTSTVLLPASVRACAERSSSFRPQSSDRQPAAQNSAPFVWYSRSARWRRGRDRPASSRLRALPCESTPPLCPGFLSASSPEDAGPRWRSPPASSPGEADSACRG